MSRLYVRCFEDSAPGVSMPIEVHGSMVVFRQGGPPKTGACIISPSPMEGAVILQDDSLEWVGGGFCILLGIVFTLRFIQGERRNGGGAA
jgi:hypothetical protein